MGRCIGARDLGLDIRWRFRFVPVGEIADTTPGVVYLDVGGAVKPGVIDHHFMAVPVSCTADLVYRHREMVYSHLLGPWLGPQGSARARAPGEVWTPTVVLHTDPDWDAVVATYLVICLIESGDFPSCADELVEYAREVDQGRFALPASSSDLLYAPHLGYLAIQNLRGADGEPPSSNQQLERGLGLLGVVIGISKPASGDGHPPPERGHFLTRSSAFSWRGHPEFQDARELLERDFAAFERDSQAAARRQNVLLPARDGGSPISVRGFIATEPTTSALNKYWVRASGYPFFICPEGTPAGTTPDNRAFPGVILSLDPTFESAGRRPSLAGLGFALEQEETRTRKARNRGLDDRGGPARFPDGYCDNHDPWYDGRGHDWTIVGAPHHGTVLEYEGIVKLATSGRFWGIPLKRGVVSLIWVENDRQGQRPARASLQPFVGMSPTLLPLYRESTESPAEGVGIDTELGRGIRVQHLFRLAPPGTCPAFRIMEIRGDHESCLEDLVEARRFLIADRPPDYSVARVQVGTHFSAIERIERILKELGGDDVRPSEAIVGQHSMILFSGRTLVLHEGESSSQLVQPDPEREVLLYLAFAYETLVAFSSRIGQLVPPGTTNLDRIRTKRIREDFLRFQTRYYQLEVSRSTVGRGLFREMSEAIGLADLYQEVQMELDRLRDVEDRLDEDRRTKAAAIIEAALYFLTVAGLLQTIVAFLSWEGRGPGMWWWVVPVLGAGASLWVLFWLKSRQR